MENNITTRLTRRAGLRRRLKKSGLSPRGKNGTFSEKSHKKGSQNGVQLDHSMRDKLKFFHEFPGSLKFQDEMPGAGKRCVDGAYATRKNHEKSAQTDRQALALGNIGSLKKRRLRRNNKTEI